MLLLFYKLSTFWFSRRLGFLLPHSAKFQLNTFTKRWNKSPRPRPSLKKSNLNQTFTKLKLFYQDLYVHYRLETSSEYLFQKKRKINIWHQLFFTFDVTSFCNHKLVIWRHFDFLVTRSEEMSIFCTTVTYISKTDNWKSY